MPRPVRKQLRLRTYDYASAGAYFVTVCVPDRECIFGSVVDDEMRTNRTGELVERCWLETPNHFPGTKLDPFVLMPNHVHAIVFLEARATHASPLRLGTIVGSFKAASSCQAGKKLWQRGYYDRVLRNEAELEAARDYIANNPLRWALDRENPNRM